MPQGSVLGPVLFIDYCSPIASITRGRDTDVHCYADDTQLHAAFTPGEDEKAVLHRLELCIEELRKWMALNRLKLNEDKTEFVIFGTPSGLKKVITISVSIGNHQIATSTTVRNIAAFIYPNLSMDTQIHNMCKTA